MAIEQQFDDSKEGLRKKRLRELAAQQEQEMKSPVPEQGIEEDDITSIPMRKELIGKLKQEMPVAGEIADMVVPASLLGGPKAIRNVADEGKKVTEILRKMFMGQPTEKLEQVMKLPLEQQKQLVEAGKKKFQQLEAQKIGGKIKPASNPLPGKGIGEVDLGDYGKMPKIEESGYTISYEKGSPSYRKNKPK